MDITQRLLNLILARRYQFTDHVIESMDEDSLTLNDLGTLTKLLDSVPANE